MAQENSASVAPTEPADSANEPSGPQAATLNSDGTATAGTSNFGIPTTPEEIIRVMNYWLIPFILASIVAVWIVFERLVVLRHRRVIPRDFADQFLEAIKSGRLDSASAISACEKNGSPLAHVFEHAVRKWGKPSVEIEQAIIDGGERQIALLRRHLRGLNGVAAITPLIGLFGTVVGMIQSFNEIARSAAMGNAEQLAGGIGTALLTTAFGLMIAIPATVMHLYLTGKVEWLVTELDDLSQKVVWLISAESQSTKPTAGRSKPKMVMSPAQPEAASQQPVSRE